MAAPSSGSSRFRITITLSMMARDVDWLVAVVPGDTGTIGLVSREVLEALGPQGGFRQCRARHAGRRTGDAGVVEIRQAGGGGAGCLCRGTEDVAGVLDLPNVVLSPHQGSATTKTRWAMGDLFVRNLIAHRDGNPLITPVV